MNFQQKLHKLMTDKGLNQAKIVRGLKGPGKDMVSRWLKGEGIPDMQTGLALARFLGVSLDYLADDAMDEPPEELSEKHRAALAAIRARERIEGEDTLTLEELIWRISGPVVRAPKPAVNRPPED